MIKAPRAFDISNHFMEWQGFNCDKDLIPKPDINNKVMRIWCRAYLSAFTSSTSSKISDSDVDKLINEIALYYGVPGFYWGVWAGIQSGISLIDFDYSNYSGERLIEYWNWKRWFLKFKLNSKI
ncbi:unnamed protein product [Ambrosiozyma monospora]|uniref:ethanolamine kinase n=1 Tax=Ambrosiozyma monospora TaxID=43982 RepID=A0A9W6Z6C6_AMBMO|nr:unnamed protein product [Ambrosiozyma monospora]